MTELSKQKKINALQKLINICLLNIKRICETMNSEDDEFVSYSACELIDSGLVVTLSNVDVKDNKIYLYIELKYKSVLYQDYEGLTYELSWALKEYIGDNVIIVDNLINTNIREW